MGETVGPDRYPGAVKDRPMRLQFAKMHGLGNDFVVIDAISQSVALEPGQIRHIAHRHRGVGCDQLLLVEPSTSPGIDFRYRIFNADGGEVEQCGNGARCFARFVRDQGLTAKNEIAVETKGGIIRLIVGTDDQVSVDMGRPCLEPVEIPFIAEARACVYPIDVGDAVFQLGVVSVGNPHGVLRVGDVDTAPVGTLGPTLERHQRFPRRANIGFMEVVGRDHIRLRVFERGVGETRACGTGACAAVVAGRLQGLLDKKVNVDLPGGRLRISWPGEGESVTMTGPATRVFEGWIEL
jgi:diaminopimelate epimerase